ncbi:MAG: flavodoxin-dependent (E)-4-hydroxy-3-methylbut-2-enyl-diphosphate synthase [Oscillospiraceae bacterium]|jgi:(E)-4-hydroxy-3-methylbut-2-enyl-diphosphate synthase|nr:flavodoxin-dependent (E)-4-hydroxy-3-methylbut-2-enyl-diphosphate synthase [Oscillospiraceae bacterium]
MTKQIKVGSIAVGGGNSVAVQSMTTVHTYDVAETAAQINALADAGCGIVRVAVPTERDAFAIGEIKRRTAVPIVADIHFNYRLALICAEQGADKIRINPGNIGGKANVKAVADACASANIPIRVGVNSGSLERDILAKYNGVTPEALVESAERHIRLLEDCGFYNICVSMKSADVADTVKACRIFSGKYDYPLHLGITAAGAGIGAAIKSAVGIGALLLDGIGDTVRVSVTGNPLKEPEIAIGILEALGLRKPELDIISCPTCGRCAVDLERVIAEVRGRIKSSPMRIAVMGCEVNGPGEAKEADYGIACGPKLAILFAKGRTVSKVPMGQCAEALADLILGDKK